MTKDYVIVLMLYFIGMGIRMGYERLKRKGRVDSRRWTVLAVVFAAMCLMWASWFNLCPLDPWPLALPETVRWMGFGLFVVGLAAAVGAVVQLRGVENIERLVTTGLFARVRHPMYLGFILWIPGWALYHGALFSLLFGAAGIATILCWRKTEETELARKFGDAYLAYCRRTWF